MIGKIITTDLTSRLTYTIIGMEGSLVIVRKNINAVHTEPYEGPCPAGEYITLADVRGTSFSTALDGSMDYSGRINKFSVC